MEPDRRRAVSSYLETFILVAVAAGGSAVVYSAMGRLASGSGGAAFVVTGLDIRQGPYQAVETAVLSNTGTVPLSSFSLSQGGSAAPSFCISMADESSGDPISFTPPPPACGGGVASNPTSLTVSMASPLAPGQSAALTVVVYSAGEFAPGSLYYAVFTAGGASGQASAVATAG